MENILVLEKFWHQNLYIVTKAFMLFILKKTIIIEVIIMMKKEKL